MSFSCPGHCQIWRCVGLCAVAVFVDHLRRQWFHCILMVIWTSCSVSIRQVILNIGASWSAHRLTIHPWYCLLLSLFSRVQSSLTPRAESMTGVKMNRLIFAPGVILLASSTPFLTFLPLFFRVDSYFFFSELSVSMHVFTVYWMALLINEF